MKKHTIPLLSLLLFTTVQTHAAETTTDASDSQNTYNALETLQNGRFDAFEAQLREEIRARRLKDDLLHADIDTLRKLSDGMQERVKKIEDTFKSLNKDMDNNQTLLHQQATEVNNLITALRSKLKADINLANAHMDGVDNSINAINANIETLSWHVNNINSYMNDLRNQFAYVSYRLTNLENFANALNAELARLKACVANHTCIAGGGTPNIQVRDFSVYAQAIGRVKSGTVATPTGLSAAQWGYCAISGGENVDVRDFGISVEGGQWVLRAEVNGGGGGGNIYGRCIGLVP